MTTTRTSATRAERAAATTAIARQTLDLADIVEVRDLLPWKVSDLSIRPYPDMWSMNPSIHFDGETWRCVLRCTDYAMPGGVSIRGAKANKNYVQSNNALVILDPASWKPAKVHLMKELDEEARVVACASIGFEDMRLFQTERGGLQGIAASLHLDRQLERSALTFAADPRRPRAPGGRNRVIHQAQPAPARSTRPPRPGSGGSRGSHPPEQVLLSFDESYNIVDAKPLRGPWNGAPQKNWVPFDGCTEARFLYSIDGEVVFDIEGPIDRASPKEPSSSSPAGRTTAGVQGGTEIRLLRRPVAVTAGRASRLHYSGIRGGTQLVHVGDAFGSDSAWLGLGHEMRFLRGRKFYWHSIYLVDSTGRMLAKSPPIKLSPKHGIEFAAGLAVDSDGDRAVISFGLDDMHCKLAETRLSALLETLEPVQPKPA
jgi:hypothetical protein